MCSAKCSNFACGCMLLHPRSDAGGVPDGVSVAGAALETLHTTSWASGFFLVGCTPCFLLLTNIAFVMDVGSNAYLHTPAWLHVLYLLSVLLLCLHMPALTTGAKWVCLLVCACLYRVCIIINASSSHAACFWLVCKRELLLSCGRQLDEFKIATSASLTRSYAGDASKCPSSHTQKATIFTTNQINTPHLSQQQQITSQIDIAAANPRLCKHEAACGVAE